LLVSEARRLFRSGADWGFVVNISKPVNSIAMSEACTQPACVLQDPDVDKEYLAKVLVRMMAGEDPADIIAEEQRIRIGAFCEECTLRVLGGHRPFLTDDQRQRLVHLGHWTYQRNRRRRRHDSEA
jgi:hypothetical protein